MARPEAQHTVCRARPASLLLPATPVGPEYALTRRSAFDNGRAMRQNAETGRASITTPETRTIDPVTTSMEWLEVVDENDVVTGLERRGVIHARGLMHRSAQVLLFNSANEVFLQKRSEGKDEFPGLWDSSAAGHVNPGEDYADCARRELAEELGITAPVALEPLFRIPASAATGWEHCSVFRCRYDGPLSLQADEVVDGKWLSASGMHRLVEDPDAPLTPAIRRIWRRVGQAMLP